MLSTHERLFSQVYCFDVTSKIGLLAEQFSAVGIGTDEVTLAEMDEFLVLDEIRVLLEGCAAGVAYKGFVLDGRGRGRRRRRRRRRWWMRGMGMGMGMRLCVSVIVRKSSGVEARVGVLMMKMEMLRGRRRRRWNVMMPMFK